LIENADCTNGNPRLAPVVLIAASCDQRWMNHRSARDSATSVSRLSFFSDSFFTVIASITGNSRRHGHQRKNPTTGPVTGSVGSELPAVFFTFASPRNRLVTR